MKLGVAVAIQFKYLPDRIASRRGCGVPTLPQRTVAVLLEELMYGLVGVRQH
jgi:hypothetical protein